MVTIEEEYYAHVKRKRILLAGAALVLAAGADRPHAHWERRVHGLCGVLVGKGLLSVDEMRRGWELGKGFAVK